MKKTLFAGGMLLLSSAAFSSSGVHWGYTGDVGPDNWAKLSPEYSACTGKNQSPINLTGFIEAELKPIAINYKRGSILTASIVPHFAYAGILISTITEKHYQNLASAVSYFQLLLMREPLSFYPQPSGS